MKAPDIPDCVSPIVGYRVWDWDAIGLRSLNGEVWFPGRALTAKCPKTDHEPPADGCSCGVYAAKNYQHLQDSSLSMAFESCVHGEVYLWGRVVEHDLGYRAEFAYPKSLVLLSNTNPRLESTAQLLHDAVVRDGLADHRRNAMAYGFGSQCWWAVGGGSVSFSTGELILKISGCV